MGGVNLAPLTIISLETINLEYHRGLLGFVKDGLKDILDRGFLEDYNIIDFKPHGRDYVSYFLREGSLWRQKYTREKDNTGPHYPRTPPKKISFIENLTLEDIPPNLVLMAAERIDELIREPVNSRGQV